MEYELRGEVQRNFSITPRITCDLVRLDGVEVAMPLLLLPLSSAFASANLAGTDEGDVDEALVLEELPKDLKETIASKRLRVGRGQQT